MMDEEQHVNEHTPPFLPPPPEPAVTYKPTKLRPQDGCGQFFGYTYVTFIADCVLGFTIFILTLGEHLQTLRVASFFILLILNGIVVFLFPEEKRPMIICSILLGAVFPLLLTGACLNVMK